MVARVISQDERSRAMSFIFGGLHVGSLLGLFVAPPLIEHFGWPVVFYGFGILGEFLQDIVHVFVGLRSQLVGSLCRFVSPRAS